jgi:protease-4
MHTVFGKDESLTSENGPTRAPGRETPENEQPRRRRRWPWVLGGLAAFGLLFVVVGAVVLALVTGSGTGGVTSSPVVYEEEYVSGEGTDRIAVVPVQGQIVSADSTIMGPRPTTTPEGLRDALRQAAEDDSVVAVILEVNSPGGGVTASDEMHQSILDFKRETGKPVVVSMGDVAASGGYYVSAPADEIVANETTLTGSLGVILPLTNFAEAADRYGIKQYAITSGEFKNIGSAFKELTPEEREILQSIVDQNYGEFVEVIVEGRDLSEERVREIADGRIYSGAQAKDLGLVDSFGGLDEAAQVSRRLAEVDEATVIRYTQTPTFRDLLQVVLGTEKPQVQQILEAANLDLEAKPYYLYQPGL